jgi:hypothetical protein
MTRADASRENEERRIVSLPMQSDAFPVRRSVVAELEHGVPRRVERELVERLGLERREVMTGVPAICV